MYFNDTTTTVISTLSLLDVPPITAASSFRMMLFMVLSSCGLRRHLGTGERTLLNVSWLIFEVENEFIRASAARGKCPIPEPSDAGGGRRHPPAQTPSSRASSDTSTSMFRISSVSYSCIEMMTE